MKLQALAMAKGHSAGLFKFEHNMFGENGLGKWTMSRCGLESIMDIKSAAFIPLKSNGLQSSACVGASSIIKSPSGCRLKKNLLSANGIDSSPVQGHCSWFAPAWKWAPRYFMGQCSAHNIAGKSSRCHCNWITFPFNWSLNAPFYCAVTYKTET